MPIEIKVVRTAAGIRNARARMPFRFGVITMRASPTLTLEVGIEDDGGRRARGYAADFLAFRWFDKRPEKSLADNCADLIRTVEVAGGLICGGVVGWLMVCFTLFSLHTAPLAPFFMKGGFNPGSNMFFGTAPDRGWARFAQGQSNADSGALSAGEEFVTQRYLEWYKKRREAFELEPEMRTKR